MKKNYLNIIFLILLLIILLYYLKTEKIFENFRSVFGTDSLVNVNDCKPENNCFLGNYARTQIYQNVCQPHFGLNRQKIPLEDNCQRTFNDFMATKKNYYVCNIDKHLNRRCKWIKK